MHQSARVSPPSRAGAYVALTKPRIIELLLVTTVPTMVVAEQGLPSLGLVVATMLGGTLAAGGANAINMYIDRDIDRLMRRTQRRPLVTGVISARGALTFAIALEVVAFLELWLLVNLLSAVLAVSATLFYVFVYTLWLKRTSRQNIVIGGAAGAVPVLVGWSAVTGSLGWAPVVLFAVIFYWTPRHPLPRGLRRRVCADAPRGGHLAGDVGSHPRLHSAALGPDDRVRPSRGDGQPLHRRRRRARRRVHSIGDPAHAQIRSADRREGRNAGVRLVHHLHHLAVRGHGPRPAGPLRRLADPFRRTTGNVNRVTSQPWR
jgi:hypothetical protein